MAVDKNLVFSPHPLLPDQSRQFHRMGYRHGENLAAFLRRSPIDTRLPLRVMVNDKTIARADWQTTPVRSGQIVSVRTLVHGGDGSDPVQTALTIAVLIAAPQLAPQVNAGLGLAATSTVGTALVTVGGMYLASQLYKPPVPVVDAERGSPTYSLQGARNATRLHAPLQLLIGTHRMWPDNGAKPYTSQRGSDQYLHQVFNFGLSDLTLSDFKIGDTAITSFSDYELEESAADGALDLFPGNVDSLAGSELTFGDWIQLTSSLDTRRLGVDIAGLVFYTGKKGLEQLRVTLDLEYSPTGAGSWTAFSGSPFTIDHGSRDQLRFSKVAPVTLGQYDVRCRFSTLTRRRVVTTREGSAKDGTLVVTQTETFPAISINHSRVTATINWVQLKSYQPDNTDYTGQKRVGLEIRASAQLNGVIEAFNAMGSAQCEAWTGAAWVSSANSNPAWWFRWLAKGQVDANGLRLFGAGYSDAQIDEANIKAWGAWCTSKGLSVNFVFDQPMNVFDMLSIIARVGRASLSWGSGKLGVVYDEANQPAVGVFGMANIRKDSFRVEYLSQRGPDEIVLNWINPALGYQQDTVRQAVPGVVTPVNPVTVDVPGITNEAQAGKEANLIAAEQEFRVRVLSWETDIEGLAVARGNVVALSHDVTQWGSSGRLISGTTTVLQLDREVDFDAGGPSYYIGLREPDGSYAVHEVVAQSGLQDTITLVTPLASAPGKTLIGDVSAAVYSGVNYAIPGTVDIGGVELSADRSTMYVSDRNAPTIRQYALSTPGDVSTASDTGLTLNVSSEVSQLFGVAVSADESKIYVNDTTSRAVYQYNMLTPGDLSTASYSGNSLPVGVQETNPYALFVNAAGSRVYVMGSTSDRVHQYTMTTPGDLSTASYDNLSVLVAFEETTPTGVCFSADGLKMYVVGRDSDAIYQYTLTDAADVSTAIYDGASLDISGEDVEPWGVRVDAAGALYFGGGFSDTVYQYQLPVETNGNVLDYIWCFEPKATPGKLVKITDIKPVSEHHVRITATDEDPNYYLAENDAYVYTPPATLTAKLPTISNLSIEVDLIRVGLGFGARVTAAWDIAGEYGSAKIRAGFNDAGLREQGRTGEQFFTLDGPDAAKVTVEVTAFNERGLYGPGGRITASKIYYAKELEPDDVPWLTVLQNGNNVVFRWGEVTDIDLSGYEIRYGPRGATSWENATVFSEVLKGTNISSADMAPGDWTFFIKAKDTSDIYSLNATSQDAVVVNGLDLIVEQFSSPNWPGVLNGFVRHFDGALLVDSTDDPAADDFVLFDEYNPAPVATATYETIEVDIDFDDTARVWGEITSALGPGQTGLANPQFEIDHRLDGGAYDGYEIWSVGEVNLRYAKARVVVDTSVGVPYIQNLQFVVDQVEEEIRVDDLVISAGGSAITFPKAFHKKPFVSVDTETGSRFPTRDTVTFDGFNFHIYDTTGADVGGTGGYTAKGV